MKKQIFKVFSFTVAAVLSLGVTMAAACSGDPGEETHTHTYATTWTSDETNHWHAATCEHTSEKKDVATHDTNGANGSCSVCGYVPEVHEHTYADTWTSDETNHWHAATCGHTNEKKDEAAHDTNGVDGACSVCGYLPAPHEHTYADTWTSDETGHWHAATCEHEDEKIDFAAHTMKNYVCTECGYYEEHEHVYETTYRYDINNHWLKGTCCKIEAYRYINIAAHDTDGANGSCSVCGFSNIQYVYSGDHPVCPECGGCLNQGCTEHTLCGEGKTSNFFEVEDAKLKDGAWAASLLDRTNGPAGCWYLGGVSGSGGVGATWNITVDQDCTVTLRVRSGRRDTKVAQPFTEEMSVFINGEEFFTESTVSHNPAGVDDSKVSFGWVTLGCIKLVKGENTIRLTSVGTNGLNLDKIDLMAAAGVNFTFVKTDNTAVTS